MFLAPQIRVNFYGTIRVEVIRMMLRPNDYKWINGIGVYFFYVRWDKYKIKETY